MSMYLERMLSSNVEGLDRSTDLQPLLSPTPLSWNLGTVPVLGRLPPVPFCRRRRTYADIDDSGSVGVRRLCPDPPRPR